MEYNSRAESPWRTSSADEIIECNKEKRIFILSDSLLGGYGTGDLLPKGKINPEEVGNFIFRKLKIIKM